MGDIALNLSLRKSKREYSKHFYGILLILVASLILMYTFIILTMHVPRSVIG